MPLVVATLATDLKNSLGFSSFVTSSQTTGLAQAIIDEIKLGIVTNAPGTINGAAPPSGGPLIGGMSIGGLITGLSPSDLASKMETNMGFSFISAQLLQMATSITTHVMTGIVSFSTITGTCSNTPVTAGVLVGQGAGGLISGLSGAALAALIAVSYGGVISTQLLAFSNTLVNYIETNATVTYASGSITGTCSAGGGPIIAGAGIGGTIA